MVHFQSAKEPYFSDAETNELLRLRLQFSANNPEKKRKRTKLHQSIIDTLVKDLQNNPGGFATAHKVGEKIKKYLPIWFKNSIKKALNILPHQIAAGEFFEFNLFELSFGAGWQDGSQAGIGEKSLARRQSPQKAARCCSLFFLASLHIGCLFL